MDHSRKNILLIAVIILLGVGVYSFNLNNPLFWDDDDWIINNVYVHSISWENIKFWFSNNVLAGVGLQSNYYRPFLFFTFALNWVISETKPFLWHLVSDFMHIANAILVFILLRKYAGQIVAFLAALIFIIHPLNTEAVTYIAGRGDPLSVFFMLLALFLWMTDIECRSSKTVDKRHSMSLYKIGSLGALVLAILSRETGVIFPFLLMVFYVAFMDGDANDAKKHANYAKKDSHHSHEIRILASLKNAFKEALPYFGVVAVYGILRLTVLNFQNTLNFYAAPNLYSENIIYRLFTFMHVLVDYFRLLFVPTGLHMERSMVVHTSLFQWPVWPMALLLVGLFWWLRYLYKHVRDDGDDRNVGNDGSVRNIRNDQFQQAKRSNSSNKQSDPTFRIWLFGTGWFFVGLVMVSGITPINALIYEHWLYLPMIGFWLIIAFYLVKLFNYLKSKSLTTYYILLTTFLIYVSFFAYQSIQRNILWGKQDEFYKDILKYEPNSLKINNNLGNFYYNRKDIEQAEVYYRKAIESGDQFAQPYYNLGSILQSRGDVEGAIAKFEQAIKVDPNFYYPYQNLAVIYAQRGELTKAAENMEKLKLLLPGNPRVHYNSALVYIALNNKEKALEDLNEGLKYSSVDPETGRLIQQLIQQLTAE